MLRALRLGEDFLTTTATNQDVEDWSEIEGMWGGSGTGREVSW